MQPTPQVHDHALPDGTTVHVRPLRPDDKARLLEMWDRTSERSRRLRFHGPFELSERNIHVFTDYDPDTQYALAATLGRGDRERIVGVARFVRDDPTSDHAEFAALVEDDQQGRGIGSALVRHLAMAASEVGIEVLSGDVLGENKAMLRLIRELGFEHRDRHDYSVVHSDLGLDMGEDFLRVVDEQERRAARAALERFFRPRSVAVVGASRDPRSIGGLLVDNLVAAGFSGSVLPVNPNADDVAGLDAHPSLSALPEAPELVVVAVPAPLVNDIVDEAGELGVRAVCIISAGFSEDGSEGRLRQRDLMERARGHGLRIVGPNCMGLLNTDPTVSLNATFSQAFPPAGPFAFSSQSGALGMAVIEFAAARGVGLSTFVSVGNKADISGNDLLLYWEQDRHTDAILLYLESFGNPRKFSRIARRVSRHKPIVVVKSGRSTAGARAADRHTAARYVGDVAVDALFAQTGVIRTNTLQEMFDVAVLLRATPLPPGRRVGIVTNAGGPGVLAADACEANGLEVASLSPPTLARLEAALPGRGHHGNPVDLVAGAGADQVEVAVRALGTSTDVDMLLAIHIPIGTDDVEEVAAALARARRDIDERIPIVSVIMARGGSPSALVDAEVPNYAFPENAAEAMGRVAEYAAWRRRPLGRVVVPADVDAGRGREVVEAALDAVTEEHEHPAVRSTWLGHEAARELLHAYGITPARSELVTTIEEAAAAQRRLDVPVAVKLATTVPNKSAIGGVELGRRSARAAAAAARDLLARFVADDADSDAPGPEGPLPMLVQEMLEGIEMVVGVRNDPSFGPVVVTGLGGELVELIADQAARITPLTDRDIDEMLADLRMRPLLDGYRGAPPGDIDGVKNLLARINAMVEDLPEIIEVDLNPVFVTACDVKAADVRIRVAPIGARSPEPGHSAPSGATT